MKKYILIFLSIIVAFILIFFTINYGRDIDSPLKNNEKNVSLLSDKILSINNSVAISEPDRFYDLPNLSLKILRSVNLYDRHLFASKNKKAIITDQEARFALDEGTDYSFEGSYVGDLNTNQWQTLSSSYVSPRFKADSDDILYLYRDSNDYLIKHFSQAKIDGSNWQNIISLNSKNFINGFIYPSPNGSKVILSLTDENFDYFNFLADINEKTLDSIKIDGLVTSVRWSPSSQLVLLTSGVANGEYQEKALSPLYLLSIKDNLVSVISADDLTHAESFIWTSENDFVVTWNTDKKVESGNQVLSIYNLENKTEKLVLDYKNTEDKKLLITYPTIFNNKIYYLDDNYLYSVDVNLK